MCLTLLNDVIIIIIVISIVIIIMYINIITPLFYKYWFLIELINRILYSGTSPLGHLCIQGTQNLAEDRYSHNLFIYYLCWRNTSIQGKGTLFLGPESQV